REKLYRFAAYTPGTVASASSRPHVGRARLMSVFSTRWTANGILLIGGLALVTETTAGGRVYTFRLSRGGVVVSRCCAAASRARALHQTATAVARRRVTSCLTARVLSKGWVLTTPLGCVKGPSSAVGRGSEP